MSYSNKAGQDIAPPEKWPPTTHLTLELTRPTLLVFVHPHCPCSKASIGELDKLMAHCQGRMNVKVLFLNPMSMPADWVHSDLWTEASRIPGVSVLADAGGSEAQLFHMTTSGETALYDAAGNLIFHGGLTISRGNAGDNPGCEQIESLVLGEVVGRNLSTPTFGCPLFQCASNRP